MILLWYGGRRRAAIWKYRADRGDKEKGVEIAESVLRSPTRLTKPASGGRKEERESKLKFTG